MKPGAIYINAVLGSRSRQNLDSDKIKRMTTAPTSMDAVRVLLECGYSEEILTCPDKEDIIINNELKRATDYFIKLCPDDHIINCFLTKHDYHNAKAIYKSKFYEIDLNSIIFPLGTLDVGKLKDSILNGNYANLPDYMKKVLNTLDLRFINVSPPPKDIDLEFEKLMYEHVAAIANKIKNKYIKNYFLSEVDLVNIKAFAKCRLYKTVKKDLANIYINGGNLEKEKLLLIYDGEKEKIKTAFINTPYNDLINSLIENLKDLSDFEDNCNNFLVKLAGKNSENNFDINKLFYWFILKLEELKAVKMILTAKKFNLSRQQLKEILKGAYEGFR